MSALNQEERVLGHLENHGVITGLEAARLYRVQDLPKRISVLKQRGYTINKVMKIDGAGTRYASYSLAHLPASRGSLTRTRRTRRPHHAWYLDARG